MGSDNAGEGGGLEKIQSSLKEVQDFLAKSKNRQKKLRRWGHGATMAILIVFAIYAVLFYQTLRTNLSAKKFAESVQLHTAQMAPVITDATMEVLTQVSPVYMELATEKANALMPTFLNTLERQMDIFITNMSTFAQKEFQRLLEKIVRQVADEFRKAFPDLTDEQIESFITQTDKDIQTVFLEGTGHIVDQTLPEIIRMSLLVESLEDKNLPEENMELTRLFLHKLLLMLDKEIMEGSGYGR
ncbi:MAG: hypothetical protein JRI22_22585 [Deltaproteobacteria bacterium]|nr:hypothetical protein [Deltaproteobacteria bacterium]